MSETDRIEKIVTLRAPRARVWRALASSQEFGDWFGATFDGPFVAGAAVRGRLAHPDYRHLTLELQVERMDHERWLSFRWHPYAVDPTVDYSAEPTTLVEFRLDDTGDGGTRLTITESGFDRLPAARRGVAFRMNAQGWAIQAGNVERHVGPA